MASRRPVDDSDEEEATALELRSAPSTPHKSKSTPMASPAESSPSLPSRASLAARSLPSSSTPAAPAPAPPRSLRTPMAAESGDDEATEFLPARPPRRGSMLASPPSAPSPRAAAGTPLGTASVPSLPRSSSATNLPAAAEPTLRARGRAVPIGGEDERSVPNPAALSGERSAPPRTNGRDATEPHVVVDGASHGARPLPHQSDFDDSATGTASVPRITRLHVAGAGSGNTADGSDDAEPAPAPARAVRGGDSGRATPRAAASFAPSSAAFDPSPTEADAAHGFAATTERIAHDDYDDDETNAAATADRGGARRLSVSTDDDAAADGMLVVEAPSDAVVIVNGVERGRGHVRVGALDRHARHAVRIHRPGFHTWSGSVSLDGKPAAKIRPTLKPRSR